MKKHSLQAQKRTIIGRKAKTVRAKGNIPATIYGKDKESLSVEVSLDTFIHTFKNTGETGLIELSLEGSIHPVLVKQTQLHPVTGTPIHVEFHEVNLREKIKANVPVVLIGESPAVKEGIGTILHLINEIEVEALPTDLPEHIEINIQTLTNINDQIIVKDCIVPGNIVILTDPEIIVVKIGHLTAPEPEPTPEEAPKEEETPPTSEGEASVAPEEKQTEENKE